MRPIGEYATAAPTEPNKNPFSNRRSPGDMGNPASGAPIAPKQDHDGKAERHQQGCSGQLGRVHVEMQPIAGLRGAA